jgi:hypothetical protein
MRRAVQGVGTRRTLERAPWSGGATPVAASGDAAGAMSSCTSEQRVSAVHSLMCKGTDQVPIQGGAASHPAIIRAIITLSWGRTGNAVILSVVVVHALHKATSLRDATEHASTA